MSVQLYRVSNNQTEGGAVSKKTKKANAKLAARVSEKLKEKKGKKAVKKEVKAPVKTTPEIVGVGAGREAGKAPAVVLPSPATVLAMAPAWMAPGAQGLAPGGTAPVVKSQMSGLDAAAKVLGESKTPLNCPAIIEAVFKAGYWTSNGKTPAATIHTAIVTEIAKKGDKSRFEKVGRGLFSVKK